ncbi:MAG TPA: hypothetical protein PKD51_11550 [Saprospiraceae bacterium]|nr:hypothetical protein [Saprospiraceae bacterium]HMU03839.1 hypothetical protein [Saprospiraceae bacterium]
MINKKQLSIGNYLESDGRELIITGHYLSNLERGMTIDNPIEISDDYLLNFGFEISYKSIFKTVFTHKEIHCVSFIISKIPEWSGFHFYDRQIKSIKYLHQLQNFFTLVLETELEYCK